MQEESGLCRLCSLLTYPECALDKRIESEAISLCSCNLQSSRKTTIVLRFQETSATDVTELVAIAVAILTCLLQMASFESRPGYQLSWLKFFRGFLAVP